MTAPLTTIPEIDAAISDEKLLHRAAADACRAMTAYFCAGRSTREAIKTFETLRQQFDQARIDRPEILRRRSETS